MNRTSVALVALLLGLTTAGCHRRHYTRVVYVPAVSAAPAPVVQTEAPPPVVDEEAPPPAPAPPPRVEPAPRQVIVPAPQMSARATVVIVVPPMAPPPAYAPAPRQAAPQQPQQPQQGNGAWFDSGE